jgi:uncharacterized protein (TIGR02996 family)
MKKKKKGKAQAPLPIPSALERALVRDILDTEEHRLVLADWLEEQGDAVSRDRADLIRTQCELARIDDKDPRREELKQRESALLTRLKETWLAPLERYGLAVEKEALSRGLLQSISIDKAETFCKLDEQLFEAYPSLCDLFFANTLHLFRTPHGSVIRFPPLDAAALAASPNLARIRRLTLINSNLGPEGILTLAASGCLGQLEYLFVMDSPGERGLQMAEYHHLGDYGLAVLASSPVFERLRELDLWENRIGPEGTRVLAQSPHLKSLRELTLANNPIGDEGAAALAGGPALASLEELLLRNTGLGPKGAEYLARSTSLAQLRLLHLREQRVGRHGLALLRERFGSALDADEDSAEEPA